MIVIDIETSGLHPERHGIWQIGALDLENPTNQFIEEGRIDDEDNVEEGALKVTGKTEEELRDTKKQSQKKLIYSFFNWAKKIKNKTLVAQNPPFDYGFLFLRAKKYNLEFPFKHKTFDLHTIAAIRYFQVNGEFLVEEGFSKMSLSNILKFCGIPDMRIQMRDNKIVKEGKPHNALDDAKLEGEALYRLLYGKPLLKEYSQFKIPGYLTK